MGKASRKFSEKLRVHVHVTKTSGVTRKYFVVNVTSRAMLGFRYNFRLLDIQKPSKVIHRLVL